MPGNVDRLLAKLELRAGLGFYRAAAGESVTGIGGPAG
jgi:hypothetical protein